MITISIEDKPYSLPENWKEISCKDLLIIADLYTRFYATGDFLKHALVGMLGIRRNLVLYGDQVAFAEGLYRVLPFPVLIRRGINKGKVKVFSQEDLFALSELLSWINSPSDSHNTLTKNLLPRITVRRKLLFRQHLFGPGDHLRDVIAIEFAKADAAYLAFCSTGDPSRLDDLVGTLYRPRKWYWRLEKLFTDQHTSSRRRYTERQSTLHGYCSFSLSLAVKYAVFLFFQGCRNELLTKYPEVFSSEGGENSGSIGWAGVFRALTNENIVDIDR
ncbi:MAG: hypothetical protein JW902_09365, partial [Syntrophaceae bacterium]|nr:hypothetical protein [Syntrophaceae bacterium]